MWPVLQSIFGDLVNHIGIWTHWELLRVFLSRADLRTGC